MYFQALKKDIQKKNSDFDIQRLQRAYDLASGVHIRQKRKTGEPYIIHPIAVAALILKIGGNENTLCAALLHDVIEDCEKKDRKKIEERIIKEFGSDVFFLVHAVTKDGKIKDEDKQQKEYCEQIQEAFTLDISVFFLKMADLLHNASTINGLHPQKQEKWIQEFKELYIPLMVENFHKVCFYYHDMYLNLMDEAEKMIEAYEKKLKK